MEATIEMFHTQKVFRTILDCMARPGKIGTIERLNIGYATEVNEYVASVALTLLDREVRFHLHSENQEIISFLQIHTMAKHSSEQASDFYLLDGTDLIDFAKLKKGTLDYPDESTTVICKVQRISEEENMFESGLLLKISGPGVQSENRCYINGILSETIEGRNECNTEFPLGIDMILLDEEGHVCCLPRSSKIEWEVL